MSVFDWCLTNRHEGCKRKFERFQMVPNKKRGQPSTRLEYLGEWVYCECTKRGCECYKARKERDEPVKKAKPRRRKK